MKKIISALVIAAALGFAVPAHAQSKVEKATETVKTTAKKGYKGAKKGVKKAGNETAEQATKAKARVTDKKSEEWVGPNGQDIYVDDGSKYYWVDDKGKRIFVGKEELKAKG